MACIVIIIGGISGADLYFYRYMKESMHCNITVLYPRTKKVYFFKKCFNNVF